MAAENVLSSAAEIGDVDTAVATVQAVREQVLLQADSALAAQSKLDPKSVLRLLLQ